MNSIAKLGLAVVFAISSASAVIAAEHEVAPADDATTTGSIGGSFDTLMMSIDTTSTVDLAAVTDATIVNFVTVSSLTDADPAALDAKLQENPDLMTTLQASIESNAALKSKIEAGGYAVGDIIAVEAAADGSFTFYVDDRA